MGFITNANGDRNRKCEKLFIDFSKLYEMKSWQGSCNASCNTDNIGKSTKRK
jgi:hypothetical protein